MRGKTVRAGEWVRVRPLMNKRYPADGHCRICRRMSCAPGWFSIKSREFRCTKRFDQPCNPSLPAAIAAVDHQTAAHGERPTTQED
jgi:hypothetical protein